MAAPKRFVYLDALRAAAALSVVIFHWDLFDWAHRGESSLDVARFPFFDLISPVYLNGRLAIDLFYMLSGFIFFHLYADSVRRGAMTGYTFILRRIARLYPLHVVSLVAVALGQVWYLNTQGAQFGIWANDTYHFVKNLLLVQYWGGAQTFSFNQPAWTISVEMVLYLTFFVVARRFKMSVWTTAAIAALGFAGVLVLHEPIARGVLAFYLGGTLKYIYDEILARGAVVRVARWLLPIAGVLWAVSLASGILTGSFSEAAIGLAGPLGPTLEAVAATGKVDGMLLVFVLFPLSVLALALADTAWTVRRTLLERFGSLSYSMYLIHYPLQMVFGWFVLSFAEDGSVYYEWWMMVLFLIALLALSGASFRYLEDPARRWIRVRFEDPPAARS